MLTKSKKEEIVRSAEEVLEKQKVLFFTKFSGIAVSKLNEFRRELRKIGGEFRVVRKTLLQRAFKNKSVAVDVLGMPGEVGIIIGYESEVDPAKVAMKFGKENQTFKIISGILGGSIIDAGQATALAKLPTKDQLLGQLVGVLQAPIANFQGVLSGNMRGLVIALSQISKK